VKGRDVEGGRCEGRYEEERYEEERCEEEGSEEEGSEVKRRLLCCPFRARARHAQGETGAQVDWLMARPGSL
jgi:hypothetical protein